MPSCLTPYTLAELTRYFLTLGSIGFGGPVSLVGHMYRDLVEERNWIAAEDYKEGLALSQLMPGPLAAQLAIYLGYVHYRVIGAAIAGIAFVLPSFLIVVAIGWAYLRYGGLPWMQAVFYGVGAAVIGIITIGAIKLTARNVGRDRLLLAIFLASATLTVWTESESVWQFLAAGVAVWLMRAPPRRWFGKDAVGSLAGLSQSWTSACVAATGIDCSVLLQIAIFFAKAGAFVFGSGLAIVPFLYAGVVNEHHWLTERQFIDAVAVAMITPGPVVITVGFIGYLVAGLSGATVASLATFLPCYLFTVIPAPHFKKYGRRPGLVAFINGVTAAAIGAIAGAVIVLARRSIVDITTALIAIAAVVLLWKVKRLPEPVIVAVAAVIGLLLFPRLQT